MGKVAQISVSASSIGRISVIGIALMTSGCLGFIPASGPNSASVYSGLGSRVNYALVNLSPKTVDVLAQYEPAGLAGAFISNKPPPNIKFGIGDVVSVTIFEAAAGGLFIPTEAGVRPGNFVTLPNESVDADGNISVPYAGVIKAYGVSKLENDSISEIVPFTLCSVVLPLLFIWFADNLDSPAPFCQFSTRPRTRSVRLHRQ